MNTQVKLFIHLSSVSNQNLLLPISKNDPKVKLNKSSTALILTSVSKSSRLFGHSDFILTNDCILVNHDFILVINDFILILF